MPKDTQATGHNHLRVNSGPPQGGNSVAVKSSKNRLSAKLRTAIDLIARDGTTQREAARRSGMNETALGLALKKPHVAIHLEQAKALFAMEMSELRGTAKAIAIRTGIELMTGSKSDTIKARMVEFFAGEGRQPLVNVSVSTAERGIYAYQRPRDITPPPDSTSGGMIGQAIEIEGKAQDPVQQRRSQAFDGPDGAP
jgi:autotransporter translocation and assembly factor TamB